MASAPHSSQLLLLFFLCQPQSSARLSCPCSFTQTELFIYTLGPGPGPTACPPLSHPVLRPALADRSPPVSPAPRIYARPIPILRLTVSRILSLRQVAAPSTPIKPSRGSQACPPSTPSPGLGLTPAKVACHLAHSGAQPVWPAISRAGVLYWGLRRFHFPSCLYFRLLSSPPLAEMGKCHFPSQRGRDVQRGGWREAGVSVKLKLQTPC